MHNAEFTPRERALIARVQNAPQPDLKPETYEIIRQQLLAEVDLLPAGTQSRLSPRLSARTIMLVIVVVAVAAVLIYVLLQQASSPVIPTTVQPDLTSTPLRETITPSPVFTSTPLLEGLGEVTPEAVSVTPAPTSTLEATATLPATDESVIVIEGPVSAINANTVTIFNMNIRVEPGDPILTNIAIGDTIQVTGKITVENGVMIVVAINITVVNISITQAAPGSALPPDCKVTKKGHIKCSKKK